MQESTPEALRGKLALAVGEPRLQGLSRPAATRPLLRLMNLGGAPAAPALGEHEHQGPEPARHALRRRAVRAVHGQHAARPRRCRRSPITARCPSGRCPRTAWRLRPCSTPTSRPGRTSTRLPAELQSKGADAFVALVDGTARDDRLQARRARPGLVGVIRVGSTSCRRSRHCASTPSALRGRSLTRAPSPLTANVPRTLSAEACGLLARLLQAADHAAGPRPAGGAGRAGRAASSAVEAIHAGERINVSEDRPVLHTALRAPRGDADRGRRRGRRRARCTRCSSGWRTFAEQVRGGEWRGPTAASGSAPWSTSASAARTWGRRWRTLALRLKLRASPKLTSRFVSNVDGSDFWQATRGPRPGAHAVRRRLEDVRHGSRRWRMRARAREWIVDGARRGGGRAAFRGGVDERRARRRVRHRPEQHVRLLGLGRRALLAAQTRSACR